MTATTTAGNDATTEEVRRFVADLYDAFATGDATAWVDRITGDHDAVAIGTDPDEFWDERDHMVATMKAQVASMSEAGFRLRSGTPHIGHRGDVAWIADEPTMVLPDAREIPMRMTAVLTREEDGWRYTHAHLSVGVPNEGLLDLALPV